MGAGLEWPSYDNILSDLEYLGGSIYIGIEFRRQSAPWGMLVLENVDMGRKAYGEGGDRMTRGGLCIHQMFASSTLVGI